jgi:hypothetical protein
MPSRSSDSASSMRRPRNGEAADARVLEAVRCFRELFRQIREQ